MTKTGSDLLTSKLAEYLASLMADASPGHCVRVDDVNATLAPDLASALGARLPGVAVHILRAAPESEFDFGAARAI